MCKGISRPVDDDDNYNYNDSDDSSDDDDEEDDEDEQDHEYGDADDDPQPAIADYNDDDDDDDDEDVPLTTVTLELMDSGMSYTFNRRLRNIGSLKLYIQKHHDIPFLHQIIVHQGTLMFDFDKEFTDVRDELGRADFEVYTKIEPQFVEVVVSTSTGESITVEVHSKASLLTLKSTIEKKIGLSERRQELTVMGVVMTYASLIDYYITSIPLQVNLTEIPPDPNECIRVTLINEGINKDASVEVDKNDSIYKLHGMARSAGLAQGFNFYLVRHNNNEFVRLDGYLQLAFYGIENGENIYVHYDDY